MNWARTRALAAIMIWLAAGAVSSRANTLPRSATIGTVSIGVPTLQTGSCASSLPVACSFTNAQLGAPGSFGSGGVTISGGSDPSIIVRANSAGKPQDVDTLGQLVYYIELVQLHPFEPPVPLDGVYLVGNIGISPEFDSGTGNKSYAQALIELLDPSSNILFYKDSSGKFDTKLTTMTVGIPYKVILNVEADSTSYGAKEKANAQIDPTFTLDPADQADYAIIYSPGLLEAGGPGIPEPAAWSLMFVGFAGLGLALRARRTRTRWAT